MPINGLVVMTPTSIASTGTGNSSSINADGSVDFATCATLSLNGVFTSSYDNYMIVCRAKTTGVADYYVRLRVGGTDNSTASSYTYQYLLASSTSVTGLRGSLSFGVINNGTNTQRDGMTVYFFGPYLTQPTAFRSVCQNDTSSAAIYDLATTHNQSTSYDGITLYPSSGSISGLVTVFGFNQ